MDIKNSKNIEGDYSVVPIEEDLVSPIEDGSQSCETTNPAFSNNRKVSISSQTIGPQEANNNYAGEENEFHSRINGATNEDNCETSLERDYEKDYQTVLRLKQQMEQNELNPLRNGRRSILSHLTMPKKPKECKLLVFIIFLFVVIIVGLVVIYHFHEEEFYFIYRGRNFILNEKTLAVKFSNAEGKPVLAGHLWRSRPVGKLPFDCSEVDLEGRGLCLLWKRLNRLEIHQTQMNKTLCYDVTWMAMSLETTHWDCFELEDANWYGGGISQDVNAWPLERSSFSKRPFISGTVHDVNGFGPVLERYWLSSKGVAIIAKDDFPIHISINGFDSLFNKTDQQFCIYSDVSSQTYSRTVAAINANLSYTICIADDIQQVHLAAVSMLGRRRSSRPPTQLFMDPVWSTWSFFKDNYNQSILETYSTEIMKNEFPHSLLMLDDGWEEHYGDMVFSVSKFYDPKKMISNIQNKGFKVSLWSHSQVNTNSLSFQNATYRGYLVRDASGSVPGLTQWWNGLRSTKWHRGVAGIIDVSANATSWHKSRLNYFKQKYNIDSFHFFGGEVLSLPAYSTFEDTFIDLNEYTQHVAEMCSSFGDLVSVQSAYRSQHLPILIRLSDGTSTWNETGGIRTVIPTVLTMGLIGYPFFIPGTIGGSAYDEPPSRELYIRWLQLSAFFPIMHFSIPPFYYDNETASLTKEILEIRSSLVVPEVIRLVDEATEKLIPIIRPIWWNAPTDKEAFGISTEFLVGDSILVAPIMENGARKRDIYLTEGLWEDRLNGNLIHPGPKWLYAYDVPLDKVPYFIRK